MRYYQETSSERAFREAGPIVHLYTKGKEDDTFFKDAAEFGLALNYIAISVFASGCRLLAFAVMSNHFHFILEGEKARVQRFWNALRDLLGVYFSHHGGSRMLDGIEVESKDITTMQQLRSTIAYVVRNSFVVRTDVNVFADPRATGNLYFNPEMPCDGVSVKTLNARERRLFTRSRKEIPLDERIFVKNGYAQKWSFVDYKRTEEFFDNARQYVYSVLKNVEAMVETALECGESPFLNDDELWAVAYKISSDRFHSNYKELDRHARKKLVQVLKTEYHATNKQCARIAKLQLDEVNAMFPLSSGNNNQKNN